MKKVKISRRNFIKSVGALSALAATCSSSVLLKNNLSDAEASVNYLNDFKLSDYEIIKTYCRFCGAACGVNAFVRNGRFVKLDGMTEHPLTRGMLCSKGNAGVQHVYAPDRLKYPLKRAGERGDGNYKRITWDEALDTVAEKMLELKEKYGAESVVLARGSNSAGPVGEWRDYIRRLFQAYGSPNDTSYSSHICGNFGGFPWRDVYGGRPYADIDNTNCMLFWGSDPSVSSRGQNFYHQPFKMMEAKDRGAKIISVDPMLSGTAAIADLWIPLRPGTDGALALGMANIIINENLHDQAFIDQWTVGFEEYKQYVKQFTPEKVAEITWVPKDKIIELARTFGSSKSACIVFGHGMAPHTNAGNGARAITMLIALTGNVDIPGGQCFNVYGSTSVRGVRDSSLISDEQRNKRLDLASGVTYPHYSSFTPRTLYNTLLTEKPYPIKGIYNTGCGSFMTEVDSKLGREAFMQAEFIVCCDIFMSPVAQIADIVLPNSSPYESEMINGYYTGAFSPPYVQLRRAVIEPLYESWPEPKLTFELAKRLGYGDLFWDGDVEACFNWQLEDLGITVEELRNHPEGIVVGKYTPKYYTYIDTGFRTPSGKVEFTSGVLANAGMDPLPVYEEPWESPVSQPGTAKEYPLIFNTAKKNLWAGTMHKNLPWIRELEPDPVIEINPTTAVKLGIEDGEWVIVESPRNAIKLKARYFEGTHPEVVRCFHGFWQSCPGLNKPGYGYDGANANSLPHLETECPIGGGSSNRSSLCKVRKLKEGE